MTMLQPCLYRGEVVHVRVAPRRHVLSLKVFNLFLNVEELDRLSQKLRLFSYNRFNLFSISDKKWGSGGAVPIAQHVRTLAEEATGAGSASQHAIGTGVAGGMFTATFLAIFFSLKIFGMIAGNSSKKTFKIVLKILLLNLKIILNEIPSNRFSPFY